MSSEISDSAANSAEDEPEVTPGHPSVQQFTKDGFSVLMEAIKHANALPTGRDWSFYKTSESFTKIMSDEGSNVLGLMNQIMRSVDIDSNIKNKVLDDKTELVIEANDVILERVANNIDEMNGIRKVLPEPVVIQTVSAQLPVNGSWNRINNASFSVSTDREVSSLSNNCIKLITARNIVRPQKFFKDKIDNSNHPWEPKIKEKPNSLKPLAVFLEEYENREEFCHPYEYELDRFNPTPEQVVFDAPKFPKPLNETPLIEIDKVEQLNDLVETLRNCKEFSVDLEHHSYRSFMGITCLLQISTAEQDYLIDTLKLRGELSVLNEVFTKNSIVKIFHGAERDIEWLQRDLGIYVVNMFDTHQAAKILEYSALSLAFLLRKFCDVIPNKQFQLADWRIRPLPAELKIYAREDTHYLIYIYQMLKKELLRKGKNDDKLLKAAIERSTEICKRRFFKAVLTEDSHLNIYRRSKKMFDNRQLYALREIYGWRDRVARQEDESLGYVLPNHMLLQISEALPREMQGILACCNPIPPLVKSNLLDVHQIVLKARDQPLEKAILKDNTTGRGVLKKMSKVNVDSPLHCPHDLSKTVEFRDDLPTLLFNSNKCLIETPQSSEIESDCSTYLIFNKRGSSKIKSCGKVAQVGYLSPYERYKLVKPYVQEEEKKKEEAKINQEQADRTDEERIASVREHFLEMSRKFSEEMEAKKKQEEEEARRLEEERNRALIEMGGTRKRKRESLSEDEGFHPDYQIPDNHFHTPLPFPITGGNFRNLRGRKRNSDEMEDANKGGKKNRKKKNKNLKGKNQNEMPPPNVNHPQSDAQQNNAQQRPKSKYWERNNRNKRQANPQNNNLRQKDKAKNTNPNDSFVAYDYSSFDFRQFQGGAGSANTRAKIQPSFRGKNRRKQGNRGAKSSTGL